MKTWMIYIVVILIGYAVYVTSQAERDDDGAIISEGTIDAFKMRVGDCFDDESGSEVEELTEVVDVPGVPCSEPHDNEVFAIFDLTFDSFPEAGTMTDLAFDSCLVYFEEFVKRDYETSSLDIMTMSPTQLSWTQENDKEVVCAVYDVDLNKLEGSVKGLGL